MKYKYIINGFDITDLVYSSPTLTKKVGKGSKILTNNLAISLVNENNIFSAESAESLIYDYRDKYDEIEVELRQEINDLTVWRGVVDNIDRDTDNTIVTLICVESVIKILSTENFIYYSGDGYVGDMAYAGDDTTPAEHQLAILRRYLNDDKIDIGSFLALKEIQTSSSILCSCEIKAEDKKTPIKFLQDLLMNMGYFDIKNDKITVRWYEEFLGDLGTPFTNEHIISINPISKRKDDKPYYSFAIIYDNVGSPLEIEGSIGDSGTATGVTSNTLTDSAKEWEINQWKDRFIFVDTGASKEILRVTGNNKTQIFFSGCTKSGTPDYVLVENDRIYRRDFSDYPIKVSSGVSALGSFIITKSAQEKLEVRMQVIDLAGLDTGDNILINVPEEGLDYQPFEVVEMRKSLEEDINRIVCIDRILYPILEEYQITAPDKVTGLTGYRVEENGSAMLTWDQVSGAAYYRIYYGVLGKDYTYTSVDYTDVNIIDNMERWLGYYFWVSAVNYYGIEGELSDPLYLARVSQESGYIDGTEGYLIEKFSDWGLLEDYHYLLTYKNVAYGDIGFLLKTPLVVLDRSQSSFTEEITQVFEDQQAAQTHGPRYRRLGYIDGAGTSTYLPEWVDDSGTYKIKNSMTKRLTLDLQAGRTTFEPGATIPNSENWYLRDGADEYYTYWFETGIMMDIAHPDQIEWFKVWKINRTMGIWESGDAAIVNNDTTKIGTLTDSTKNWNTNQWEDYYLGIVKGAATLDIEWYKIISNTSNTITFDYGGDDYSSQAYIINNESYIGFHGLIMDDVWTSMYRGEVNMSDVDDGTAETVTATYLWDDGKSWMSLYDEGHWEGFYVSINGQTPILIEWSDNDTLYFTGNPTTGSDLSYQIMTKFYVDYGMYYWEGMAAFTEIVVEHCEDLSYAFYRNWDRCERGIFILNTWPDNFAAYTSFVAAVNKRYQNFVMFEALQMTWNMANEVTKQYIFLDWHEVADRWDLMKITAGVGQARLAILGYPYNQQAYISHLAGSFIMSSYSNGQMEDITAAGNIVLDQLYYDTCMAGNKDNNKTIGFPTSGYETGYDQNQYDRYGLILRKFEGAYVFYNPSRQFRTLDYIFSDDVVNYHTGEEYSMNETYTLLFPPRTAIICFKNNPVGEDAFNYLRLNYPYTYCDFNTCWIIFTTAGESLIGANSVWIENGYTGNKRFILDGDQAIPEGEPDRLLHAGDGADTYVLGYNPDSEILTGGAVGASVQLTSLTVLHVAKVIASGTTWVVEDSGDGYAGEGWLEDYSKSWTTDEWAGKYVKIDGSAPILIDGNDANNLWLNTGYSPEGDVSYEIGYTDTISPTTLVPNTDYLIEQKEWDATPTGKGKWKTYIYLLTDQSGLDLTTYYYDQGEDDGWPAMIHSGEQYEHGVFFKGKTGFALKTGNIAEGDCSTYLTEGTHYYLWPVSVRHKWDFRIQPFGVASQSTTYSPTINLNMIYEVGGNKDVRALHWGIVDPENAIMVRAGYDTNYSINGKKATYTSKTITRPKVLIFGFTKPPRDDDFNPILPANRETDQWLFENGLKKFVGIHYDEIWVTGDWDGVIETGSADGAWGSIRGIINDSSNGLSSYMAVVAYFDIIIINDTFLEYKTGSPSGVEQWKSWLHEEDYLVLKDFKKVTDYIGKDTMIIDRRMGANAFVWYDGSGVASFDPAVQGSLLNRGYVDDSIPGPSKEQYIFYSDLTDIFGVLYYAGVSVDDISQYSSNIHLKAKSGAYVKYSEKFTSDYRIGKIVKATDHYSFDEDDTENHPVFNIWEQGGDWISFLPKSAKSRDYIPEARQLEVEGNLFLLWYDISNMDSGEGNFEKYAEMGLNNIVYRREPVLIYHSFDFFNVIIGPANKTYGLQQTAFNLAQNPLFLGDTGKYKGCRFFKADATIESFISGRTLFLREAAMDEYAGLFLGASGYKGNYISSVSKQYLQFTGYDPTDYVDFGYGLHDEHSYDFQTLWGFWFAAGIGNGAEGWPPRIDWGNVINFDTYNDELATVYGISKGNKANGLIPWVRSGEAPLEGSIVSISKSEVSGYITIKVNFDVTEIDTGEPLVSGIIQDGKYSSTDWEDWFLNTNQIVNSYRNGSYFIHIHRSSGTEVYNIRNANYWKQPPEWLPNDWLSIRHSVGDPNIFNGDDFDIMASAKEYRIAVVRPTSNNNVIYNGRLVSKNIAQQTLTLYCGRGVSQPGAGGYLIAYQVEDEEDESSYGNREKLGGRIAGTDEDFGVDIADSFRYEGDYNSGYPFEALESAHPKDKPTALAHYEWAYGSLIEEFGYEKNTGLISCQAFYPHGLVNRPPVLVWPGISEEDVHMLVNKYIGTKLTFNNLQIVAGDIYYLYYNSFNEMLRIKDTDVEEAEDGHYKVGNLKSSDDTLIQAIVRNIEF